MIIAHGDYYLHRQLLMEGEGNQQEGNQLLSTKLPTFVPRVVLSFNMVTSWRTAVLSLFIRSWKHYFHNDAKGRECNPPLCPSP
jgi:hypothetical protein